MEARHVPALLAETTAWLAPQRGGVFVDCTLGMGGHAAAVLAAGPSCRLLGIDRDAEALALAGERLAPWGDRVHLARGNFADLAELVGAAPPGFRAPLAGVLADLGVSSLQLDEGRRGFSFRREGPLDMRMDASSGLTAADIVNTWEEADLEQIFREYGEEREARRIARAVGRARDRQPLATTLELREVVAAAASRRRAAGRRPGEAERIDPSTRVFQALRIAVNAELAAVSKLLDEAVHLLADDGRLVVISYHSLEDRIVKNAFRDLAQGDKDPVTGRVRAETQLLEVLTKKPVRPNDTEVAQNPRSRSARLRAARRL
jgi:16S rRNA (cytosine1402-N4)-methyltransferase